MSDPGSLLPDRITLASSPHMSKDIKEYDIWMITGNPGLISYYTTFLHRLASDLGDVKPDVCFNVQGQSLGGFEFTADPSASKEARLPLSLQQQIELTEARIYGRGERTSNDVILIGHSVGAYILLEILKRFNATRRERQLPFRIVGGIALFPTVVDIAKSPSGLRAAWLLRLPYFAVAVGSVVQVLMSIVPIPVLQYLVGVVTGFPRDAAACTTAFLRSPNGVRQALYMARDEMNEITLDRWDDDIWGSEEAYLGQRRKLFFYFGSSDHWVADRTRDEIIASRAQEKGKSESWKPRMEVDETGIPHGFCIRHSEPIARKCAGFIRDIVAQDMGE